MIQLIFKNNLYVYGKSHDVLEHLKYLSDRYTTVKNLIENKTKPMVSG